ncbi:MAG: hypothetical protein QGH44_03910 [Arenicellales bacterium]|nr:hypothetical protein [Arenicellales bacterium]
MFKAKIWRRDGVSNEIRSVHKTLADYFQALGSAGWEGLQRGLLRAKESLKQHQSTRPPGF